MNVLPSFSIFVIISFKGYFTKQTSKANLTFAYQTKSFFISILLDSLQFVDQSLLEFLRTLLKKLVVHFSKAFAQSLLNWENLWYPFSRGTSPFLCVLFFRQYFRSEEHTSELQSRENLVCRLLLEKIKNIHYLP